MAINTGVNVSKTNTYTVISTAFPGVDATKTNAYTVLSIRNGVNMTKANGYVVLGPAMNVMPAVFIIT